MTITIQIKAETEGDVDMATLTNALCDGIGEGIFADDWSVIFSFVDVQVEDEPDSSMSLN